MNLADLDAAVRARLGLDPATLGPAALGRAVQVRMAARGVTAPDAYLGMFATDPAEPEALAVELAVPETWFFRGGRALFDHLARSMAARAAARPAGDPVRALTLPCSTGEEPYSLSMALFDRGLDPERFRIEGVDLSVRHLDRAAAGRFHPFSFREPGPDPRPTHFRPAGDWWEILPHVKAPVRFRAGNATDPAFLQGEKPFDVVICRNLFIYLTPAGRAAAMATLDRLLAPDGWLCLSPAEADRLPPGRFAPEGSGAFGVYRRTGTPPSPSPVVITPPPPSARTAPVKPPPPSAVRMPPAPLPPHTPLPPPAAPSLDAARTLADAGRTADARAACQAVLAADPERAEAHTLLGVIHLADGRLGDAREAFRRAMYLDPDNPDALFHMAVLCDREGRPAEAARYRERLARARREDGP
ncbi:MAG: chemotaxis protein CheW [Isosphaera sp.]|nr:chemotaxis protein CheW [Isosphaera sp.]